MKNRTTLAVITAVLVTSAAAQAADHRESPALSPGSLTTSTSSSQSNGTSRGRTVKTEMISMDLTGTYFPPGQ